MSEPDIFDISQPIDISDKETRMKILAAIPHRDPFLFIDDILEWNDEGIVCTYRFKGTEWFFSGHYPGSPIVPGVILCESAMQAGAIFLLRLFSKEQSAANMMPVVGRISDVRFKQLVQPGDTIEQHVTFKEKMVQAYFFTGKVLCNNALAARLDFVCTATGRPNLKK